MLGFVIPAKTWQEKDGELRVISEEFRLGNNEIHTAWMTRHYPEQERVNEFSKLDDVGRVRAVREERKKDLAKAAMGGKKAVKSLARNYRKSDPC